MVNSDTRELLKECDQGVKMGIESIDSVAENTDDLNLSELLLKYRDLHEGLKDELEVILNERSLKGEEPKTIAKSMAAMKTGFKMMMEDSDRTVAELMTDGCHMGIKSLNKYLNEYKSAEPVAQDMAKKIISTEEDFEKDLRKYL
ncbi:MAG: hypothetical protein IJ366_01345 [Clostridia bacterium]|nr:hypothetical protein [Clostridia bacterium]